MVGRTWIDTLGGFLICAEPSVASLWRGNDGSSVGATISDYERADVATDYLSILPCGASQVLVLGGDILRATFVGSSGQLIVVRWVSAPSEDFTDAALRNLPKDLPEAGDPISLEIVENELVMFDSVHPYRDLSEHLSARLRRGSYLVSTEEYREAKSFWFIIHRFLRQ